MPSKKQRVEATLVNRVLGDPYLGNKIKMYAICAELQEAVNDAAYALHYPFWDMHPDDHHEHFGVYLKPFNGKLSEMEMRYVPDPRNRASYKPSAFILYRFHRYSNRYSTEIIPPPPPGTYGTPQEIEALHEEFLADFDSSDDCKCCDEMD